MVIKCFNISKNYGKCKALNKVNLKLDSNKIYCLLGKNGAGKTTLLKILSGYLPKFDGEIHYNDVRLVKGEMPEDVCFIKDRVKHFNYPVKKLLKISSTFYPNWDHKFEKKLLNIYKLDINKKYKQLSFGMQTMVSSIIAFCSNTDVVILDEPVLGFDSILRDKFYNLILESYQRKPRTIIISTHLIDEIARICEEVIILDQGKILLESQIDKLYEMAYSVIGLTEDVEECIKDLNVLYREVHSNYTMAAVFDKTKPVQINNVTIEKLSLQKLFGYFVGGEDINGKGLECC